MNIAFPWYDSVWLTSFARATALLRDYHPGRLEEFVRAFDILRTDPDFEPKLIQDLFSAEDHDRLRALIADSGPQREKHEVLRFGRLVVHDAELCSSLQAKVTDRMSEWVNEPVEPSYNFLSLYNNFGICGMHLDSPSAKWTLDYCIEQSAPWPIHLGRVRPWPEEWSRDCSDWEAAVRGDSENRFKPVELEERQAVVFSGSSQWHYRDRIERRSANNFCHLLFFHFVPKGSRRLADPEFWAEDFAIPELREVIAKPRQHDVSVIA